MYSFFWKSFLELSLMFRLSQTLWKENLAHGGVMAVRLSVSQLPFEPSGGLY